MSLAARLILLELLHYQSSVQVKAICKSLLMIYQRQPTTSAMLCMPQLKAQLSAKLFEQMIDMDYVRFDDGKFLSVALVVFDY